ncbi:hypothetical protein BD770DRAFT_449394 [Pilaira anomala]|nr:hypothetical protein BD770DRAFT_449394 [Pilaira anomala]
MKKFAFIISLCYIFSSTSVYTLPVNKELLLSPINDDSVTSIYLQKRDDEADRKQAEQPLGAFKGLVLPDLFADLIPKYPLDKRDNKLAFQKREAPPPNDASISATTIGKIPGDTLNGATTSLLITVLSAFKTADPNAPPPADD